jgi:hypothetical protein
MSPRRPEFPSRAIGTLSGLRAGRSRRRGAIKRTLGHDHSGRPTSGEGRVFSTGPALQKSDTVSNFVQTQMVMHPTLTSAERFSVISPRLERPEDQCGVCVW